MSLESDSKALKTPRAYICLGLLRAVVKPHDMRLTEACRGEEPNVHDPLNCSPSQSIVCYWTGMDSVCWHQNPANSVILFQVSGHLPRPSSSVNNKEIQRGQAAA